MCQSVIPVILIGSGVTILKITDISGIRKDIKEYRFGAYVRVSTDKEDQVHSFLAQLKYFREYAGLHEGYTLVDIYADEGITGTSIDKRDEFLRMVSDAKEGRINRIVTKSISRFARNNEELLAVVRELKSIGVSIYFEKECIDTEQMSSEFLVSVFGMQAQQESKNISKNVRWSYQNRMKDGTFNTCKPPYGFRLVNNELKRVPEEAAVVKRIFDMYLSGLGIHKIASIFNKEGIERNKTRFWPDSTIAYILTNERYMGDALLQKRYTDEKMPYFLSRNKGQVPKYYIENSNEPIVTKEEFMAARRLMAQNTNRTKKKISSVYKGLLICPECRRLMRRMENKKGPYWVCKFAASKRSGCKLHTIYEEDIDRNCERFLLKLLNNRDELFGDTIELLEKTLNTEDKRNPKIHELDMAIKQATERCHTLASMRVKNLITDEEFTKSRIEIDKTINEYKKERSKLLNQDKSDELLDSLILISETLNTMDGYEKEAIGEIADRIVAEDGYLAFDLPGGLIFRERSDL